MALKFVDNPLNYTGSKIKILDQILPHFDYTKSTFLDAFAGGFGVGCNVLDKYDKVILNDKLECLINIHKSILEDDNFMDTVRDLSTSIADTDSFKRLREDFNKSESPEKLFALMTCSTNNMLRFNKKMKYNQTFGKRKWNSKTTDKYILYAKHIREYKSKIEFSSCSFENIKIESNKYMVYCDPPYGWIMNEDGNIGSKQITEAGYNAFWSKEDDQKLYDYLKNIDKVGSTFAISGILTKDTKKCWLLNKLLSDGFKRIDILKEYNKVSRSGNREIEEILCKNY